MQGPKEIRGEELQSETYTNLGKINTWQNATISVDKLLQFVLKIMDMH